MPGSQALYTVDCFLGAVCPGRFALLAGILLVGAVAALAVVPFLVDVDNETVKSFGYPGIFLVNMFGTGDGVCSCPGSDFGSARY